MPIEVYYNSDRMPVGDLVGILVAETKLCGAINNRPLRRVKVPYYSMELYRDDDRRLRVYIRDGDLNIIDLTGATCLFTAKINKGDATPVIQKSTANPSEGIIGAADEGECFFFIVPADTENLDICQYVYDVRVTLSDGKTYTTVEGVLNLLEPVS
jgi:hypothetical protein